MSGYTRLSRETQRNTKRGKILTEWYHDVSGPDDLPTLNEQHSTQTSLRCGEITKTDWNRHPTKHLYRVSWGSRHETYDNTDPFADLPRAWSMGAEYQKVGAANWYWLSTPGEEVQQELSRIVVLGGIRIQKIKTSDSFWSDSQSVLGKVNNVEFEDCPVGTLLFLGLEATEFWDSDDWHRYRVTYHFKFRSVTGGSGVAGQDEQDGWNYVYRASTAGWDIPSPTSLEFLYGNADFDNDLDL